jgi:hypothetical protein
MAAARIKLCSCCYFTEAKNPQDYSSYAVHQLRLAGRCGKKRRCALATPMFG